MFSLISDTLRIKFANRVIVKELITPQTRRYTIPCDYAANFVSDYNKVMTL